MYGRLVLLQIEQMCLIGEFPQTLKDLGRRFPASEDRSDCPFWESGRSTLSGRRPEPPPSPSR